MAGSLAGESQLRVPAWAWLESVWGEWARVPQYPTLEDCSEIKTDRGGRLDLLTGRILIDEWNL